MTFDEFTASLSGKAPPAGIGEPLRALWFDGKGLWKDAHGVTENIEGAAAAAVHAYLHRKEGDQSNAEYWYRKARRPVVTATLQTEWEALAREFLDGR